MTSLGGRWSWPAMLAVLVVGAGYASGWQLLQRAGLGLFVLLIICLLATIAGALALSAEGTPRARALTAGESLTITYNMRNRGFWPLVWTLLQPQGFSTLPVEGQLVALPPRGSRKLDVSVPCPSRGRWPAGGFTLRVGDPFGFFERSRSRNGRETITVYPRPIPLPGLPLPALVGRGIAPRGRPSPQPSATVREVRPYRSGDSPSRIHWLSTARLNELMVKEPEGEPAAHLWLVLDLDEHVQYGGREGDSVELLVGAAAHLVRDRFPPWVPTGLLGAGANTIVRPDTRRGQSERLLDALAVVEPGEGSVEQDLRALRAPGGARRGTIVVLTPWADERWNETLPALARGGSLVLCVLLDTPDSGRAAALDDQAAVLRGRGLLAYRHTAWAL